MQAGSEEALYQQPPAEPEYWRIGVRNLKASDQRYRYGLLWGAERNGYRVRFDDEAESIWVPRGTHRFDWVQPDCTTHTKKAQKGEAFCLTPCIFSLEGAMIIIRIIVSCAANCSKVSLERRSPAPCADIPGLPHEELHVWADMCLGIAEAAERGTYREASCGEDVLDALNRLLSE